MRYMKDNVFTDILQEITILHDSKSIGYGSDTDPLANIRASSEIGIDPKLGIIIRMTDKWHRIKRWYGGTKISDEKLRDNMIDLVTYGIIWLELFDEKNK